MEVEMADGVSWEPGDSFGIRCPNSHSLVAAVLQRLHLDSPSLADRPCLLRGGPSHLHFHSAASSAPSLRQLLRWHCSLRDMSEPRKAFLRQLAEFCTDEVDRDRLLLLSTKQGRAPFEECFKRQQPNLVELLDLFPSCRL